MGREGWKLSEQEREPLLKLLEEANEELAQATAAMPAHSVRPWQFQRLEDAEDQVAEIKAQLKELEAS